MIISPNSPMAAPHRDRPASPETQDDPHVPDPAEHGVQFGLVAQQAGDQRPAVGEEPQLEPFEAMARRASR